MRLKVEIEQEKGVRFSFSRRRRRPRRRSDDCNTKPPRSAARRPTSKRNRTPSSSPCEGAGLLVAPAVGGHFFPFAPAFFLAAGFAVFLAAALAGFFFVRAATFRVDF